MEKTRGALAVFIGAVSFGILSTFVKIAYDEGFTLGEVTGVQTLFGAIILWILWMFVKNKKVNQKGTLKSPKWKVILAGMSMGAVSILYYKSGELVPASIAIVLLMQYIWIGQLIEFIFFKNKPTVKQLFIIFIILAGTVLATGMLEDSIEELSIEGVVYGLLAATAYSISIIVNGRVGNDYPFLHKSALMVTGAFLLVAIILFPITLFNTQTIVGILPYGLLLSVFGTVIPPLLFAYGMPKTGYSLGSVLSAVELPIAVCMSYFVLSESVSWIKWLGVIIILTSIIWMNTKKSIT